MSKILNITDDAILDVMESGMTLREGAAVLGCGVSTLSKRIAKLKAEHGILSQYREIQSLHLTKLQADILEAITPEKIFSADLKDLVAAYKILKDKELTMDGKPNEIKGLVSYLVHIEKEKTSGITAMPASDSDDTGSTSTSASGQDPSPDSDSIFDIAWE